MASLLTRGEVTGCGAVLAGTGRGRDSADEVATFLATGTAGADDARTYDREG